MTLSRIHEIIRHFAIAPDCELSKPLADRCAQFSPGDLPHALEFIRTLRDDAILTDGASSLVMGAFDRILESHPEIKRILH